MDENGTYGQPLTVFNIVMPILIICDHVVKQQHTFAARDRYSSLWPYLYMYVHICTYPYTTASADQLKLIVCDLKAIHRNNWYQIKLHTPLNTCI